jgi:hypothetical protein
MITTEKQNANGNVLKAKCNKAKTTQVVFHQRGKNFFEEIKLGGNYL